MFMEQRDLYKYAIGECSHALGMALGDEMNKHKDKIVSMLTHKEPLLKFDYKKEISADRAVNIIHVHIPLRELHYKQVVL